jgi:hypothetical protein
MKIEVIKEKQVGLEPKYYVLVNDTYNGLTKSFDSEILANEYFSKLVEIAEADTDGYSQIVLKSYTK